MISSADWKPAGYTSCSPYLVVKDAQKVIEFAKATFGATELRRYDLEDGSIMHAEFRFDDTVIRWKSPERGKAIPTSGAA